VGSDQMLVACALLTCDYGKDCSEAWAAAESSEVGGRCTAPSDKGMETRTERLAYAESMVKDKPMVNGCC